MIPSEVAYIAEELQQELGKEDDLEVYIPLAWKIYNRLQMEYDTMDRHG